MFDIVMPLFDKAPFVGEAIRSVLAQTYTDWRLTVVDDGSMDEGPAIVGAFDDPRIKLVCQANAGVSAARNRGIAERVGEWIAFIDADDLWLPDHLAELDRVRRAVPGAGLIGTAFRRFSGSPGHVADRSPAVIREVRYFREAAEGRELFYTSSAAVRRTLLDQVGAFDGALRGGEDLELWARLALDGPVAVSSRITALYRVDVGGLSSTGPPDSGPPALELISATIPTLLQALPAINDPALRSDVEAYIDSRVDLSFVSAMRDGDISRARDHRALYRRGPSGMAAVLDRIARLPVPIARLIVRSVVAARGLVRR